MSYFEMKIFEYLSKFLLDSGAVGILLHLEIQPHTRKSAIEQPYPSEFQDRKSWGVQYNEFLANNVKNRRSATLFIFVHHTETSQFNKFRVCKKKNNFLLASMFLRSTGKLLDQNSGKKIHLEFWVFALMSALFKEREWCSGTLLHPAFSPPLSLYCHHHACRPVKHYQPRPCLFQSSSVSPSLLRNMTVNVATKRWLS